MWGPGPWTPMWGFWWIFPLVGMLLCLTFLVVVVRALGAGRGFMCLGGGHGAAGAGDAAAMRRELGELRAEIERLKGRSTSG